jgi:hypothetical protein
LRAGKTALKDANRYLVHCGSATRLSFPRRAWERDQQGVYTPRSPFLTASYSPNSARNLRSTRCFAWRTARGVMPRS